MKASDSNMSDVLFYLKKNLDVLVLVTKIVQVKCFLENKIFSAVLRNASQYWP